MRALELNYQTTADVCDSYDHPYPSEAEPSVYEPIDKPCDCRNSTNPGLPEFSYDVSRVAAELDLVMICRDRHSVINFGKV